MAGNYDITIEKGADYDKEFEYGVPPVNLTGYTAKLQIRDRPGGATLYETLTDGGAANGITLGGALGTIRIQRTAAQTGAYTFARAAYDLLLTSGAGAKTRLLKGSVIMDEATTT